MLLTTEKLIEIIFRNKTTIIVVCIFAVVLGNLFENLKSPSWKSTIPLLVAAGEEKATSDFNYDHYYSFEATDSLTDSLEEWLKSPATRDVAKLDANVKFWSADWRFWEKNNWKVRKKAPQLVEVIYYTKTKDGAEKMKMILEKETIDYLNSLNRIGKPYFNLTNPTLALEFVAPNYLIVSLLSLAWGIILGALLAIERESLKLRRRKKEKVISA